jgi:hypothetical protein
MKVISVPIEEQYNIYLDSNGSINKHNFEDYFQEIIDKILNEIDLLYGLKGNSNIISYEDHMIKKNNNVWHIFIRTTINNFKL